MVEYKICHFCGWYGSTNHECERTDDEVVHQIVNYCLLCGYNPCRCDEHFPNTGLGPSLQN